MCVYGVSSLGLIDWGNDGVLVELGIFEEIQFGKMVFGGYLEGRFRVEY